MKWYIALTMLLFIYETVCFWREKDYPWFVISLSMAVWAIRLLLGGLNVN